MSRTGRPPKPTAVHRLAGTFQSARHARRAENEPRPANPAAPQPPPHLTAGQQVLWAAVLADAPARVLAAIDTAVLETYVVALDQHRRAVAAQNALDHGKALPFLSRGDKGTIVMSPYLRIITRAADQLLRAGAELGFTPSSRARLAMNSAPGGPAPDDPHDPWAAFSVIPGGRK